MAFFRIPRAVARPSRSARRYQRSRRSRYSRDGVPTYVRRLLLWCATLITASSALAGNGGSSYSLLGLGDLRYLPGTRSAGMGYTGIGVPGTQFINSTAPATWARLTRTRVEAGFLFEGFNSTDGRNSRFLAHGDFAGALLAIPVSPANGVVFVAGFTPYSNVDFNTYTSGSFLSGTDTLGYTVQHTGTGGLGQAQLGLSYAPQPELAFGASLNYLFGSIDNSTVMTPTTETFAGGRITRTSTIKGIVVNLGTLYSGFGGALSPLSLGFNVSSRGVLSDTKQSTYEASGGPQVLAQRDTSGESETSITVPLALGVGLSWVAGERWVIAADYRTQAWASSEFEGRTPAGIRNSSMAGIGFERIPSTDPASSYWDRCAYRFGFVYNATYYKVNGRPINDWSGTAGISFPVSGDTRLNFSIQYGIRGMTSNALIKDKILRFTASLSLSELWFVRPEED